MKTKILLIFILIVLVILSTIYFLMPKEKLFYSKEIEVFVIVGEHLGFNINDSLLQFGTVLRGSRPFKTIFINNDNCDKCRVELKCVGDLCDWVHVDKNNFYLYKNESNEVTVYLYVPNEANFGNYSASLKIYFWKTI